MESPGIFPPTFRVEMSMFEYRRAAHLGCVGVRSASHRLQSFHFWTEKMTMVSPLHPSSKLAFASNFFFTAATLVCSLIAAAAASAETYDIEISTDRGMQTRVVARFEHNGKVIVANDGQLDQQKQLPMNTVASMAYYQRLTGTEKDPQAIRYFESSKGNFNIEKGKVSSSISPENRMIVARLKSVPGQRLQMASVLDTLSQSEFELIKNPADPLTYANLLGKRKVKIGEKWKTNNNAVADFLAVDRILFNETQLLLKAVVKGTARIYMLGKVDATIDDVATGMKVSGIFDVNLKTGLVTDVRLSMSEVRQAGQVAAGFEGKTKIDIRLSKDRSCKHLSNDALKKYTKSRRIKQKLQWASESGKFALEYDPRWRVIAAEQEAAVLRYVDDGDLMAQCDVVQLPARPANNPLTLVDYKREVEKIIRSDETARIADAQTLTTANGLNALKIVVKGEEKEVPVQWIYYHVASQDGRRLTFVFTLEQEIAGVFQPSDQRMVNGLSFSDVPGKTVGKYTTPQTARRNNAAKTARQR